MSVVEIQSCFGLIYSDSCFRLPTGIMNVCLQMMPQQQVNQNNSTEKKTKLVPQEIPKKVQYSIPVDKCIINGKDKQIMGEKA